MRPPTIPPAVDRGSHPKKRNSATGGMPDSFEVDCFIALLRDVSDEALQLTIPLPVSQQNFGVPRVWMRVQNPEPPEGPAREDDALAPEMLLRFLCHALPRCRRRQMRPFHRAHVLCDRHAVTDVCVHFVAVAEHALMH